VLMCRRAHFVLYVDTQNILTYQQMHFDFMAVILLHSGHQHVAAGNVVGHVYITAHRRYVW